MNSVRVDRTVMKSGGPNGVKAAVANARPVDGIVIAVIAVIVVTGGTEAIAIEAAIENRVGRI